MGNFSRTPEKELTDALDHSYVSVRFQQGKPVLDRELNLAADLASPRRLAASYLGNGVASGAGFSITNLNVGSNDFTITAGRALVNGMEAVLLADTTYRTQPVKTNVAPLPAGASNIYLRVFTREVTGVEDPALLSPADVKFETSVRDKVEWEVLVSVGTINAADHLLLATMNTAPASVRDSRRLNLSLAAARDDLDTARGSAASVAARLNVSLTPTGAIAANAVGSAQIVDNSVTAAELRSDTNDANDAQRAVSTNHVRNQNITEPKLANNAASTRVVADNAITSAKLQSHPTDDAQRAVGKQHIKSGSASLAQLATLIVTDGQFSVPASPGAGQVGELALNVQVLDGHSMLLVSVQYVAPRTAPIPLLFTAQITWLRRVTVLKPPLSPIFNHFHQVVLQNPNTFAITVAVKAYMILET